MRVLSAKLEMSDDFSVSDFFRIISKWLDNAGPCKIISERLKNSDEQTDFHEESEYCKADSYVFNKSNTVFNVFKLEQIFHEQTWDTEVILRGNNKGVIVYFHINCTHDLTRFDEVPEMRTAVIRYFVDSGFLKQSKIPLTSLPIEMTDNLIDWIACAYQEQYDDDTPLVFATTYFDSTASEIDESVVARKLSGIAHVVVCNNEYTRLIKDRAKRKGPFNGAIGIYCKGGKPRQYRKESVFHGTSLETMIIQEVQRYVTAMVDKNAPTYESLHTDFINEQAKQNAAMLDEFFNENGSLDEQLKIAKQKISELMQENSNLKSKNAILQDSLKLSRISDHIIKPSALTEFFDGEQHDLIVTILQKAFNTCGGKDTRRNELIADLLKENAIIGKGQETFDVVKNVFSNGEEMSAHDISELKRVGFDIVSESPHYKIVYKNSKYWFTVSKTPSDKRGGKNLVSDITRRLSIYK